MNIKYFFDKDTSTLTYVVFDPATHDGVIIDPVLNFDPASGHITQTSLQQVRGYIGEQSIKVRRILETHHLKSCICRPPEHP